MSESGPPQAPTSASQLRTLAATAGIDLSEERAAALAPQAVQHQALLRTLAGLDPGAVEPAAVFRLDPPAGTTRA